VQSQPRDLAPAAGSSFANLGAMGEARRRSRCADLSSPDRENLNYFSGLSTNVPS
jgi:hypothetical protein